MRSQVWVLASRDVAVGFELAGIDAQVLSAEAESRLSEAIDRGEVGVLLLEESLTSEISSGLSAKLEKGPVPIVVPFPGPIFEGRADRTSYIAELLQKAIGYRVRLT